MIIKQCFSRKLKKLFVKTTNKKCFIVDLRMDYVQAETVFEYESTQNQLSQ